MSYTDPRPAGGALHPDLERLKHEYQRLVDDVSANNITLDQAEAALAQMAVIDGTGARWSIDVDANFVFQANPASLPQVKDPSLFAASRAPVPPGPPQAPWENPDVAPPVIPTMRPARGPAAPVAEGPAEPVVATPQPRKRASSPASDSNPPAAAVTDWVKANMTTVVVAAVCVVLVAVVAFSRNSPQSTPLPSPTTTPGGAVGTTVAPSQTTRAGAPTLPTTNPGVTTPAPTTTTTAAPTIPNGDQVNELISAITSGNRDLAGSKVADFGDPRNAVIVVATFAGLKPTGLAVRPGAPQATAPGQATALWEIVDTATGAPVMTMKATYVASGGAWKLAKWPEA